MNTDNKIEGVGMSGEAESGARWLPALLLLFVGSGCAALIYEVVWFQLLQLSIGSSAISLGVLLGIYMGGMCLGSLLAPRWLSPLHHPLKVYAALEIGIGIFGILVLFAVPALGKVYTLIAGTGQASVYLRAIVAAVCLLPPTLLMGATLPAIGRWVSATPRGVSWLGFFYGGNIAGAVAGSVLAGYFLLRVYNMPTATAVAVGINFIVAALALAVAARTSRTVLPETADHSLAPVTAEGARLVYVVIGLSGLTALGAQVIWTRQLSLLFGGTTYTFSLILAVFLLGLGLGSSIGAWLARNLRSPRLALGWAQLGLCFALAWGAYTTAVSLPLWPINPSLSDSPSFNVQLDLMRAMYVILPGAVLWGVSFPLALAGVAGKGQDTGRLVGGVYAANTVGAIVGALITALVLVGTIGTQDAQRVLIAVAAVAGLTLIIAGRPAATRRPAWSAAVAGVAIVAVILLVRGVPPLPGMLVAYGRYAATWVGQSEVIYAGEGVTASVAVTRMPNGVLNYHNAGKVQASSEPQDMRLQRMLGHITTLVSDSPDKVLVIGCGAGVTAGAVSIDPRVSSLTIAEIEPLVPRVVSEYFYEHNFDVVNNPKTHIHLDDARHFLLTTDEKFDAITSDPLDPWVKGAATLYTREFFDVVKAHLNPGGIVTLFVQLYETSEDAVKSEVATFLEAFPNGAVFANTINGRGYDLVLFARNDDQPIDVDAVQARLDDPANSAITESLREVGIYDAIDLFGTYAGSAEDLAGWLSDAQINTDMNLKLQFLAGRGLNTYDNDVIHRNMVQDARYPDDLFVGSAETLAALREEIDRNLALSRR
jgi:spermidine synthase